MTQQTNSLWRRFRNRMDDILDHTHNHFFCLLPPQTGHLASKILTSFYSGITIDGKQLEKIKNLQDDAIYIYVSKFQSNFEYLFFHTRYQEENLPIPEISLGYKIHLWQPYKRVFKIILAHIDYLIKNRKLLNPYENGYIRDALLNGKSAFVPLVEPKAFQNRFIKAKTGPIQYLVELQRTTERPIYIIPQLLFFGRKPMRSSRRPIMDILFGTEQKPGRIRRFFTLFKNPGEVFAEISEPVNLKAFVESENNREKYTSELSIILRRQLLTQLNRHRQSITGPVLKSRDEIKESILTNDRLDTFMNQYAKKRKIPIYKVHEEAAGYLDEIAAKYNMRLIRICEAAVRWTLKHLYDGVTVDTEMLNKVKSKAHKGPIVFIPCHKSHMDYIILAYTLYNNLMALPLIAAGKNLAFWPMGSIFRNSGAFFIRRTFSGAMLYSKVFSEYIYKILQEGFNIEFFIEGGRSRTGKLLTPKLGLLTILMNAYKSGACDDLIFAPVYIGYDRVMEEQSYLHEIGGGDKKPESISQVLEARKLLKKRYGRIYLKFGEPVSINETLAGEGKTIHDLTSKEQNMLTRSIGNRMINSINRLSVVTPHALVASAILNSSKKKFSYNYFLFQIDTYLSYLKSRDATLAETLRADKVKTVLSVLGSYIQRKLIDHVSEGTHDETADLTYHVVENKRTILEYYKNNSISFFIPAAYTALAILKEESFQFTSIRLYNRYKTLQDFFKNEFPFDMEKPVEQYVDENIQSFLDNNMIVPDRTAPGTYNITADGFKKMKLFGSFLKPYFESSWIVLSYLMRYPQKTIKTKDNLKKIQSRGNRMYKKNEIDRIEALSRINYQNALDYFSANRIKGSENIEQIEHFSNLIKTYMKNLPS
ncbi:MAG: 1-acyl-sn-glycerol-3-phosphate acyltransferase [Desulfobacterales bacterium]|nr:1-acyl-sn-glycerol-3-phosphate acyltransferase [Desulfobacterales bacterium]